MPQRSVIPLAAQKTNQGSGGWKNTLGNFREPPVFTFSGQVHDMTNIDWF
jgi:hypothetical protein